MTRYYNRVATAAGIATTLLTVVGSSPSFAQKQNPPSTQKTATPTRVVTASLSITDILDRAAALRTEAERRSYEAPTAAVAYGYTDASSGVTRMLSLLGQYNRSAPAGGKALASRAEAQQDVNTLWGAAGQTSSSVRAARLRRAAYLYAQAAGRYFAAETREGRPLTTVADADATNADGTMALVDGGALSEPTLTGQAYMPYYAPTYIISSGYGGYGNQVIVPGGFYGGGLLTISPYGQIGIY